MPEDASGVTQHETQDELPIFSLLDVYSKIWDGRLTVDIGVDLTSIGSADAAGIVDEVERWLRRLAHEVR